MFNSIEITSIPNPTDEMILNYRPQEINSFIETVDIFENVKILNG
jgi:hypothetical protein